VSDRIISALAAACALLALTLAALWLGPGPVAAWRAWSPPAPQAPNLDDARAALLDASPAATAAYPAVLERPLLQASRRPDPAASGAAAADAPPPAAIEQVKLLGLVTGRELTGVLLDEQDERRFVRLGEKVGDWTLGAIDGRNAVFTRDGERKPIELPFTYLSPVGAAAAPPTGRGPAPHAPNVRSAPAPAFAPAPAPGNRPSRPPPAPAQPAAAPAVPPPAPAATAAAPATASTASFGGGGDVPPPPPKGGGR